MNIEGLTVGEIRQHVMGRLDYLEEVKGAYWLDTDADRARDCGIIELLGLANKYGVEL